MDPSKFEGWGGGLHQVRTLLQWDLEAGGEVHNPDPLRAQVCIFDKFKRENTLM